MLTMARQLNDQKTFDVTIEYRNKPRTKVVYSWQVHSEVLRAKSRFFAACLDEMSVCTELIPRLTRSIYLLIVSSQPPGFLRVSRTENCAERSRRRRHGRSHGLGSYVQWKTLDKAGTL
jgi:hypothetical protein